MVTIDSKHYAQNPTDFPLPQTILSIDVSAENTGYVVARVDCDATEVLDCDTVPSYRALEAIGKYPITMVVVEKPAKGPYSDISTVVAYGVLVRDLCHTPYDIPHVIVLSPSQWKPFARGQNWTNRYLRKYWRQLSTQHECDAMSMVLYIDVFKLRKGSPRWLNHE